VLASSFAEGMSALPGADVPQIPQATVAKEPIAGEITK
jgi:hypothetical protein